MEESFPILISKKSLKPDHKHLQKIALTTSEFTLGRSLQNSVVFPVISISRNHCTFKKIDDDWIVEDVSTLGITVNNNRLGKGVKRKLCHEDIIDLEPSGDYVYKFLLTPNSNITIEPTMSNTETTLCSSRKRRKVEEDPSDDIIDNVRKKFEQSQSFEIKQIENKIQNAKHMQTTSKILKQQLQSDLSRREQQLRDEFAVQIENLKGEKNEVERQKALLIEERNAQLTAVKAEMEEKIAALMGQIEKHNETESELIDENNALKEKLFKEREEFLSELNRESSSKQELLDKLEGKIREQEEIRLREKQELEEALRRETEQLRIAKEKELKQLEEQKKIRELELEGELDNIKKNLALQIQQHEQEKLKSEQMLNEQKEQLKKVSDEEKNKMELILQEREDILKRLTEAKTNAENSLDTLRSRVAERETELAALAADRIQQQADRTTEVITTLQAQLESVRGQLRSVETEKNTLLESLCLTGPVQEGTSKQTTMEDVEELMESELQCSICSELFVKSTTLNCSHTFCKYCIDMWKKTKKECPICRSPIISECKSLVLDSFIDRMIQNSKEDVKQKRQELLKNREAEVTRLMNPTTTARSRRRGGRRRNTTTTSTTNTTMTVTTPSTSSRSVGVTGGGTSRPIPTVDLTGPPVVPREPPLVIPIHLPPHAVAALNPRPAAQVFQIVRTTEGSRWVPVGGGAGASPGFRAPIMAATAAASAAALAAIGRQAARIGNARPIVPTTSVVPATGPMTATVRQVTPGAPDNARQ